MKLFFRKYGSGPNLVILHGLYGSSDNWVTIARKLSEKFTVILPDLRNHGQSPHSQEHTYDAISSDINELIDRLGIKRFILAGHSMGGKAAMKFAFKWPEKLDALVIIDISPFGSPDPDSIFFRQHRDILESILSSGMENIKSRVDAEEILSRKIESEKTRGFILKNLARNNEGILEWRLNAVSLLKNLGNITGSITDEEAENHPLSGFPVIFVRGEDSDYIMPDDFARIRQLFPAAEMINVKNASHWVHADRPDAIEEVFFSLL